MKFSALVVLSPFAAPCEALVVGARAPAGVRRSPLIKAQNDEPPPPPPTGRLGGTIDQDGKSNVWAVEPAMKVEKTDKGVMAFAPVVGVAALAILSVPLLPLLFAANPDQV